MTHKLIKTENYLLVVDESEIKVGDYITDKYRVWQWEDDSSLLGRHKIIAHLPLNGSPILEDVALLPPYSLHQEDDINELAEISSELQEGTYTTQHKVSYKHGFVDGYNKAKEKYKYTEEDMRKAIDMATTSKHDSALIFFNAEEIIQSLDQYPTEFETEDVLTPSEIFYPNDVPYSSPKKITTTQGVQWVGKYK
jgi:hypothetical protein